MKKTIQNVDTVESYTLINKNEKFNSNIVVADASVRPKDQNKYNLKTFEKFESDVVGVGVPKGITDLYSHVRSNNSEMPDDQNAKNKHINKIKLNNQISNLKHLTSDSAITLIALIITIIVLLILAGVTLNMVIGESGIFEKAKIASEETNRSQALEQVKLKVLEVSADKNGEATLDDIEEAFSKDSNTSNLTKTDTEIRLKYNGIGVIIDEKFNVSYDDAGNDEDNDNNGDKIISYKANSTHNKLGDVKTELYDLSGNSNNATLNNTKLNDDKNGIIFSSNNKSYAQIDLNSEVTFPCTYEFDMSTTIKTKSIVFIEPMSKTTFGIWNDYFILTVGEYSNTISMPTDFFDGAKKHIIIEYKSLTDFEVYINGIKMNKNTSTNCFDEGIGNNLYFGRREQGNYFDGTIYSFKIYNRLFNEDEVTETDNRENLILEYDLSKDKKYRSSLLELKDNSNNNESAICNDILVTNDKLGMIFNGKTSYVTINLKDRIEFPCTYEVNLKTTVKANNAIIFLEPKSNLAFGIWNDYFIMTANEYSNTITIPTDFYDGNLKHIVIEYKSLTDFDVYINGVKMLKNTSTDGFTAGIGDTPYLGRRGQGNYFNGTIYSFDIYNKILSEQEIKNNYNKSKKNYE